MGARGSRAAAGRRGKSRDISCMQVRQKKQTAKNVRLHGSISTHSAERSRTKLQNCRMTQQEAVVMAV